MGETRSPGWCDWEGVSPTAHKEPSPFCPRPGGSGSAQGCHPDHPRKESSQQEQPNGNLSAGKSDGPHLENSNRQPCTTQSSEEPTASLQQGGGQQGLGMGPSSPRPPEGPTGQQSRSGCPESQKAKWRAGSSRGGLGEPHGRPKFHSITAGARLGPQALERAEGACVVALGSAHALDDHSRCRGEA